MNGALENGELAGGGRGGFEKLSSCYIELISSAYSTASLEDEYEELGRKDSLNALN